jgi:L-aspartate oxidase
MPPLAETRLRAMMASHVGVIRDGERLADAVRTFASLERDAGNIALRNMATSALLVAASAFDRRESRGGHFRSDYPQTDAEATRSFLTLADAEKIAADVSTSPKSAACL